MEKKALLVEIISMFEEFAAHNDKENYSIENFVDFVKSSYHSFSQKNSAGQSLAVDISKNITYLHRYAKVYLRKAIKNSLLQTEDEYTYLMILLTPGRMNKTELNNLNIMEKTSGSEIIRRLLKHGLIEEFDDPDDKRSKLVMITDRGRKELQNILYPLHMASDIITSNLTEQEMQTLNQLISKMNKYHNNIFLYNRQQSLEELNEKLNKPL